MSIPELSGGSALWCGAALFSWLLVIIIGLTAKRYAGLLQPLFTGLGSLLLILFAFFGNNQTLAFPFPFALGDAHMAFTVDPLARWFLGIIGVVGIVTALFAPGYLAHLRSRISLGFVWAATCLLFVSMAGVVLAANAIIFLVCWELMALSSFALVATDHEQPSIRKAALIYLGATRAGTAFLMAGFLWVHHLTGSWSFTNWHLNGAIALLPALCIFIGLATKAGCWPFHLWLPIAHPAAPAPVSAVMSGVMIKTAIYMMIRVFGVGDHLTHPAIGPIILILGAISAFWGVLFALLQHDLKRLLAYHSVENIGIILMGIGIALIGKTLHVPLLAQLGLAAALFHTLNHAVFKSLLFLGTGAIDAQTHQRDIEHLGGLIHRMPWTAAAFITGSAAICALPPLNGFASEWLLYQGFFHMALTGSTTGIRLGALLLMGWLALIGALALACFVKAVGVTFLGLPRSKAAERAHEATRGMVLAQIILAMLCVVLGLAAPTLLSPIAKVTASLGMGNALGTVWSLPIPLLTIVLIALVTGVTAVLAHAGRQMPVRRYITWECGFGTLGPRMQYTATSFAQPISRLFGAIYHYAVAYQVRGKQRRHFPEAVAAGTTHEPYLETRVYAPLLQNIQRIAGMIILRLQAGSIHQYLFYIALALALLLWVGYRG
ncbi:MAG TPA: proton-conducting transporter membrane subunit [Armatimonadota bacterium]|nr:proton-conducting transporter membrane subunit [Armatimonadota bacterium]